MSKKKGKNREEKEKQLEEKYNEKIVINSSFEDLVKVSLGIKPKQQKEDKGKGSE
ncbi:hypothetical protein [Pedobacter mendelii]|uniref:Uncharacterized protein n=1 Tax=Pedobacter mendelii TaxID=1908240 RepID=A0ABQ2BHP8_9SPHI|nr:hypothetical protein [Pedobacter mendelii]GGI23657.1 hypothetical protein GCM10008119_08740 [Pedobacter mendelii]